MTAHTAVQHQERPVTRVEVIDHVADAFGAAGATRAELLALAEQTGARPDLIALLRRLPDRRFHRPHELWAELPEVPVEH